jgi:hypothetical protein
VAVIGTRLVLHAAGSCLQTPARGLEPARCDSEAE